MIQLKVDVTYQIRTCPGYYLPCIHKLRSLTRLRWWTLLISFTSPSKSSSILLDFPNTTFFMATRDPLLHPIINHRADGIEIEAISFDEVVELPSRGIVFVPITTGIVGCRCSIKLLLLSSNTTSDIVGLIAADAWVHSKAISMIFFTSSASY